MACTIFFKKYLFIVMVSAALIACTNIGAKQKIQNSVLPSPYTEPADYYLEQAESSSGPSQQSYELKAAGRLLQDDMDARASQIIANIKPKQLAQPLHNEQLLLQSHLTLREQKAENTLSLLAQVINPHTLSPYQRTDYHHLLANAYELNENYLQSAQQYIILNNINPSSAATKYYQGKIWDNLSQLQDKQLVELSQQNGRSELTGWLSLVAIPKKYPNNWQQMRLALTAWKNRYPNHAGNETIVKNNKKAHLLPLPPKQIALLLPLSGDLAQAANTVQDGFMDAYYKSRQTNFVEPKIRIYDTDANKITAVYQQAIEEGADFIVGPLDKSQAQIIAKQRLVSVPTLALNYIDSNKKDIDNFYQFGLSLNDEAEQIAGKAWQSGHRKAIIIAPENEWGQETADFFAQQWFARGGEIVDQLAYTPSQGLNESIKNLMHINRSEARKQQLSKIIHQDITFVPRSREDVDFIFLLAFPSTARQINPLLKYYYAGNIPIYAPSIIYSGTPNAIQDNDLNGIIFSEIPWILAKGTTTDSRNQHAQGNGGNDNPYIRLYALGYDAYQLSYKLNQFVLFPDISISGETGLLDLNEQQSLTRKLAWAQFKDGIPQAI